MGRPQEFKNPKRMALVLEQADYERLCKVAEKLGTKPSTLVREWLLSRLARFGDKPRR